MTALCESQPEKHLIMGVPVTAATYAQVVDCVIAAARNRAPYLVTALAVHGTVEASRSVIMRAAVEHFDIVAPDGQPVRIALNLLHGTGLNDRVYGPTLMLQICARAAVEGIGIYLYGSTRQTVLQLKQSLEARFPKLKVLGVEPSVFRRLTNTESCELGERIRASGARIVFIGLGCPRQEIFAFKHRDLIGLPQICVGAAFDFHAGTKRQAPKWMQDNALEWLFRLLQEPRRLLARYFVTNNYFVLRILFQYFIYIISRGRNTS